MANISRGGQGMGSPRLFGVVLILNFSAGRVKQVQDETPPKENERGSEIEGDSTPSAD